MIILKILWRYLKYYPEYILKTVEMPDGILWGVVTPEISKEIDKAKTSGK